MKLIGMLDSPYVRRVAISLKTLDIPFEHAAISVFRGFEAFQAINPVVKAPTLVLDDGAVSALSQGNKSLLPVGVIEVRGEFERGAAVACRSVSGEEVARGLANYSASECRRIARKPTAEIEKLLGYIDEPELIHRDNMVSRQPGTTIRSQ